ncbi:MAG TPA: ClpXP adapter SpxH family protein [Flavipsychrobacter sp.]|nr:ClpXP adapter SpxH family protein [Flavipsychrobacter sp.]
MNEHNNPLLCDTTTGMCELPVARATGLHEKIEVKNQKLKILYFTDPICSTCWGIEPQLRRLKLEYGNEVAIEYYMGGLLPDWSYNSGGISKPSDVAHHWDEVSAFYKMPIDGDVWLDDPLPSSYPPSIAFKAAQMQDDTKALAFLRRLREMVFLEKKNITHWEHLAIAARETGLDSQQLQKDYKGAAKTAFEADLAKAKQMGVRGFPTLFIVNGEGAEEKIYGFKPYSVFESSIVKLQPRAKAVPYHKDGAALFKKFPTLTTREFAELADLSWGEAEARLETLQQQKKLDKLVTKNGAIWRWHSTQVETP